MSIAQWLAQLQDGVTLYLAVLLAVVLLNLLSLKRLSRYPPPESFPKVSVLVPARNEESNIAACLTSLLQQDYPDFEVITLDDSSTDATGSILRRIQSEDGRLQVLQGAPLPDGWLGKPWACAQLAGQASGELLLFTDADTRHERSLLRQAVAALQAEQADFLTAIPREEVLTWGEKLVVPVFLWAFLAHVPFWLAHRLPYAWLSAAIGQMMLVRRTAYDASGGYAALRREVADDVAFARRIKACGFSWRIADASDLIRCRMYRSFAEAFAGLSKNLFAIFDYHILAFSFVWVWTGLAFLSPVALLAFALVGIPAGEPAPIAVNILLALLVWGIPFARLGVPVTTALAFPLIVLVDLALAARSIWVSRTGGAVWKGRNLGRVKWRFP